MGFTLTEIMTAMAIFSLVIVSLVSSHLIGVKMYTITSAKLEASQSARGALNQMRDEIRSGKILYVGTGSGSSFTLPAANALERGNALQIYPTTSTNTFVRYYLDSSDRMLKRKESGSTNIEVVAMYITNQMPFQVEDYAGNVLTNSQNNRVVRMTLEINQWEFATGTNAYCDYYRVQTKIARRALD